MVLQQYIASGRHFCGTYFLYSKSVYPMIFEKCWRNLRTKASYTQSQRSLRLSSSYSKRIQSFRNYSASLTTSKDYLNGDRYKEERLEAIEQLDKVFQSNDCLLNSEWEETINLASQIIPNITEKSQDAIMMTYCLRNKNFALGKSYMERIQQLGKDPNLATLGLYLQLCSRFVGQCGEDEVLKVYHQLMSKAKVLDVRLKRSVVLGLSVTREWRRALQHIESMRKMSQPCPATYTAFITAAFRHAEYELGWYYLDLMCAEDKEPSEEMFIEWIKQCSATEDLDVTMARAFTMLEKFNTNEIFPTTLVIEKIAQLFHEKLNWSGQFVKIHRNGQCPACNHRLEAAQVTQEEFHQLKEEFEARVVRRSDIFLSTSPQEWAHFQNFLKTHQPFSVVVDGLNVMYLSGKKKGTLMNVVRQLIEQQNGQVLVLGRNHMRNLIPRSLLASGRVYMYTLVDLSRDDAFFLHAALQSGWGTKFVTRDFLRDHLFRLELPQLRGTFRQWQRLHQIVPEVTNTIKLQGPASFGTLAQGGQEGWHIPYDSGALRPALQPPNTWLCLQPLSDNKGSSPIASTQPGVRARIRSHSITSSQHTKTTPSFGAAQSYNPSKRKHTKKEKQSLNSKSLKNLMESITKVEKGE